ncbi:MAG: MFS transporter [Firmicutes bacterium]|nr:MFS transporter [Bacillota bacterium]
METRRFLVPAYKFADLLSSRVIRVILVSQLFLQLGVWIRNFAVLLYVIEQTAGDPFAVSMISVAEYAPIFVFSFIGGAYADRWRPKRTMIWCDFLSGLSVFAVLAAFYLGTWKAVFFVTLISAILSQFSQPSGMKLFKIHLSEDQVQAGMSIYQTIFSVFVILGPAVGTFVFQRFGVNASIALTGLSFLISAAVLTFLPADPAAKTKPATRLISEMAEGIRYLLSRRVLTLLCLSFMAAGLGLGLIQPLSVFLVTENLGLPKESLQWLVSVNGAGMVLGGALVMAVSRKVSPKSLLVLGMLVIAAGTSVLGISTRLWLTLAVELVNGLVLPGISVGINTLFLQNTEIDFIGRVNGILIPIYTGSIVLTMSLAGSLMKAFSLLVIFQAAALLFLVGLGFIFLLPPSPERPLGENG